MRISLILAIFLCASNAFSHSTQVAYCTFNGNVRIYIEHWHAPCRGITPPTTLADFGAAIVDVTVTTIPNGGGPNMVQNFANVPVSGFFNNVPMSSLPCSGTVPFTEITGGPGCTLEPPNTCNYWAYFDFEIPSCFDEIQVTVNSVQDPSFILFPCLQSMYPSIAPPATILDTEDPTADCSVVPDITIDCTDDVPEAVTKIELLANDDCTSFDDINLIVSDVVSGSSACPGDFGEITRTYTLIDDFDNETTCVQLISFNDDTDAPILDAGTAPPDITISCCENAPAVLPPTFTDDCDDNLIIDFSETTSPIFPSTDDFILTRTWIAFDNCGNASEPVVQTITALCQDIMVSDEGDGNGTGLSETYCNAPSVSTASERGFTLTANGLPLNNSGLQGWQYELISSTSSGTIADFTDDSGAITAGFTNDRFIRGNTNTPAGTYIIEVTFRDSNGCETQPVLLSITVEESPVLPASVTLEIECTDSPSGTVSLSQLFPGIDLSDTDNFAVSAVGATMINGGAIQYNGPGCFCAMLTYVGSCLPSPSPVTSCVYVSENPSPAFDLIDLVCWDGSAQTLSSLLQSTDADYTINPARTWSSSNSGVATVDANGVVTIVGAGTVEICLTETITNPACNGLPAQICDVQVCESLTIENATTFADPSFTAISNPVCENTDVILTSTGTGALDGNGVFTSSDPAVTITDATSNDGMAIFSDCRFRRFIGFSSKFDR